MKQSKFSVAILLSLFCSSVAFAQTVTITPSTITDPNQPLSFDNVPLGATSLPQSINVVTSFPTTILLQPASAPWLVFPGGLVYTTGPGGVTIPLAASAAGLGLGTYTGSFNISVSQYLVATVFVKISVTGASALSAYPSSFYFSAQQGAYTAVPGSAQFFISSTGTSLTYTVQTQVQAGDPNWILLGANTGVSGYSSIAVRVSPIALSAGIHNGYISVFSTTTNDSVTIPITLVVNPNSAISVSPGAAGTILWQIGSSDPPMQQFTVSSAGGSVQFTARLSPYVSWATVTPFSTSAGPGNPATVTLIPTPNAARLGQGTYTTSLIVTPIGGADLPPVPIQLIATANPFLQISPGILSFVTQFGYAQAPPDQLIYLTAPGSGAVGFAYYSDSPWLTATGSSAVTPAVLTVHANPIGLPVGTVYGRITLYPINGDNYTETIPVSLTVTSASQLSVGPMQLLFSYQTGAGVPGPQDIQVTAGGQAVPFTVSASTGSCGGNWLQAVPSSFTTPATVSVSVQPQSISPGSCQGLLTLAYNTGSGPASAIVNVTLAISNNPELSVSMPAGFGDEHSSLGVASYTRLISLSSTDGSTPVNFSVSASTVTGGGWLSVAGISVGSTPQNIMVQVNPWAVPGPGQYMGSLLISSFSLPYGFVSIPVTLTIASTVTVSVSPPALSFTQTLGAGLPAAKYLVLSTNGGAVATYSTFISQISGGNWLSVSPTYGQANGAVQVSVLANSLPQGTYQAQIVFTFQNSVTAPVTVNVALVVGPPVRTITASPQSLTFAYQIGGTLPASQQMNVTSTGGAVDFTAATTSSGWLSVDVTSATTPKTLNISVSPQGLSASANPYTGTIRITAPGVLANPIVINVSMNVSAPATPVPVTIANAASGAYGGIAPGEEITIKGTALGPATAAMFRVNLQGNIDSTLSGVRVLFSNIPGTPLYVSAGQINVVVPYEIEGRATVDVVVEYQGTQSAPYSTSVAAAAPGLFTSNFTGSGQVIAINSDGTLNGTTGGGFAPAAPGSVLVVYATGFGQTSPHSITGSVTPIPDTPTDFLKVPGTVTATIGGQNASVLFAGSAPGLVTGIVQLNIKVPSGVSGDDLPISVSVNGKPTPVIGTTVAVR